RPRRKGRADRRHARKDVSLEAPRIFRLKAINDAPRCPLPGTCWPSILRGRIRRGIAWCGRGAPPFPRNLGAEAMSKHHEAVAKSGDFPNNNINYYWSGNYEYSGDILKLNLRQDLSTSRKNALIVAPTMGNSPGHGLSDNQDLGIFREPGGGDCFLKHVMGWL